ncbi:MAG: adenylate/guanylate cyclase domain-containing protein [Candidatus Aureabacteria bacterium]|nr:adenylate/guanylate cyclase domain-containing protein [Candidatus Auribacterota bacterium]
MKLRGVAIIVVAAGAISVFSLDRAGILKAYEDKTVDSRFRWRHWLYGPSPSPDVCIVGIDDQALVALGGRWPISWRWHALLLEALAERPPATTAYDILFPSADGQHPDDSAALAGASARLSDLVYPYYFGAGEDSPRTDQKPPDIVPAPERLLGRFAITDVDGDLSPIPLASAPTLPIPSLAERAALGFANAQGDPEDGVVRRIPLLMRYHDAVYPSFTLMAVLRYQNIQVEDVHVAAGRYVEFDIPEGRHVSIPVDRKGCMLINYAADYTEFQHSVFSQVLQSFALAQKGEAGPVDLADVEGKLVLVGITATGAIESYMKPTPLAAEGPMLTVQANALTTILSGAFPRPLGARDILLLLLAMGTLVAFLTARLKAATSLALVLLVLAVFIATAYVVFTTGLLIVPLLPSSLMAVTVYTLITSYRYATEERQRRFYRGVLGKYLSKNVMEAILQDPSRFRLGGERRELTVLFADVKGFTSFCERSPVEAVAPRLNELHDRMTRVIWKHDGTLNKYMGDGILAFWGAPLSHPDHALRAVRAALEMQEELKRMRESWQAHGIEPFAMGIGINTGTMIVGNMGSSEFWDYTVLGDEVNLASRIEGLTRNYGADVLLSEFTYRCVRGIAEARLIGEVTVKGKEKPVVVYELTGLRPQGADQPRA